MVSLDGIQRSHNHVYSPEWTSNMWRSSISNAHDWAFRGSYVRQSQQHSEFKSGKKSSLYTESEMTWKHSTNLRGPHWTHKESSVPSWILLGSVSWAVPRASLSKRMGLETIRVTALGATVDNATRGIQSMPRASQMRVQSRKRVPRTLQMCEGRTWLYSSVQVWWRVREELDEE